MFEINVVLLGLSYLIPIAKQNGWDVDLFDTIFMPCDYNNFNIEGKMGENENNILLQFREKVLSFSPDLIGVSVLSLGVPFSLKIIEKLGKDRPLTVWGGVGANTSYMDLINENVVDYVQVGYAEEGFSQLLTYLKHGDLPIGSIDNLVYKDKLHQTHVNNMAHKINYDNFPISDWSLFDKKHNLRIYKGEEKVIGNFQLTRGCVFDCTYCINRYYHDGLGVSKKIDRVPIDRFISEVKWHVENDSVEIVRIYDELFMSGNICFYEEFVEKYKSEIGLPVIVNTRPEVINDKKVKLLKKMNCINIGLGIEVGAFLE